MLFLKPDVPKKNREFFFHCLFCQTCYSPPVTSYLTQVLSFRPKSNLEGFVWSHQSITGLISRRQFVPKCQFLASRPLGCCSFQNILTNPIISQINTLLLPYFISYYSSAFTINQFHNHDAKVYAPYRLVTLVCFVTSDTQIVVRELVTSPPLPASTNVYDL